VKSVKLLNKPTIQFRTIFFTHRKVVEAAWRDGVEHCTVQVTRGQGGPCSCGEGSDELQNQPSHVLPSEDILMTSINIPDAEAVNAEGCSNQHSSDRASKQELQSLAATRPSLWDASKERLRQLWGQCKDKAVLPSADIAKASPAPTTDWEEKESLLYFQ
jgi:hypothetical protein